MHRIEQLRPLSRQHHLGLSLGLKASQASDELTPEQINEQWQRLVAYIHDEITEHFGTEEKYVVSPLISDHSDNPAVQALSQKLLTQHKELHNLSQTNNPTLNDLRQLGQQLYEHIRFEEREVFPLAQQYLTSEQLTTIFKHSDKTVK